MDLWDGSDVHYIYHLCDGGYMKTPIKLFHCRGCHGSYEGQPHYSCNGLFYEVTCDICNAHATLVKALDSMKDSIEEAGLCSLEPNNLRSTLDYCYAKIFEALERVK